MRSIAYSLCLTAALGALSGCNSLDELWARGARGADAGWPSDPSDGAASGDDAGPGERGASGEGDPARAGRPRDPGEPERDNPSALGDEPAGDGAAGAGDDAALGQDSAAASSDGGAATAADGAVGGGDGGAASEDEQSGPTITALWVWVPIYERSDSRSARVGYMRAGAAARVEPTPVGTEGCGRGWYRLLAGGYVCLNRMTTLDPNELGARRPTQPDRSAAMPYPYMTTYRAAAMYRWLPSLADMREVEPERYPTPGAAPSAAPAASASAAGSAEPARSLVADLASGVLSTGPAPANGASAAPSAGAQGNARASAAPTASAAPSVPAVANRAQAEDAGVRLEDLQGAAGSPLLRRMLSGMYVSVDREVSSAGRRFWRTQNGGYVERGAVSPLRSPPTYQGVVLDEQHPLPLAFMTAWEGWTYDLSADGRSAVRRERSPRLTVYHLADENPVTVGRGQYYRTRENVYLSARNVRLVRTSEPPSDLALNEKWIEVNLDRQMLIAYEGARPVYVTLVSTGRRNERAEDRNYETVQGYFRIQSKHITTTMDGNSAGDGPYSIEDVPWVMYFENSFALHGAFWHNLFGNMRSHGCVNMSPPDARWVFNWTEPAVPSGWHGAYASSSRPGTRIYVHYENQALGERGGPRVIPQH